MAAVAAMEHIAAHHDDLIHDVQMDYYGKQLASAGSDRRIKIFDVVEGGGRQQTAELTGCAERARAAAATARATRLAWAAAPFFCIERTAQRQALLLLCLRSRAAARGRSARDAPERLRAGLTRRARAAQARGSRLAGRMGAPRVWQSACFLLL